MVVAAETGSGKTYGYLVPLFEKVFSAPVDIENTDNHGLRQPREMTLVLCPNVMLCEQVVRMANCLCDDNGEPLLRVAAVCGRQVLILNLFALFILFLAIYCASL